jgi:Holliday junction DNA helicase RuvA
MIEYLTGILAQSSPTHAVVQTGGVGWHLPITLSAFDRMPPEGQSVTIPTHLSVKEDSLTLFGFADDQERNLFRLLLQVNGIGPKLAMTVLSGLPAPDFIRAVASHDASSLNRIPGIGKKTAERMLLELKDKIANPPDIEAPASSEGSGKNARDAILALVALGYKQQEAQILLKKIPIGEQQDCPVEELVRRALQVS